MAVQLMDGLGAAIFGVVSVLVIADLTSGTGRFNFTQGVVATATGLGACFKRMKTCSSAAGVPISTTTK